MKTIKKRLISFLLAFAMLLSMVPAAVFAADVTASEMYALLEEYYGDAAQAKAALAKLQKAGVLDRNGDVVPVDIRYNGNSIPIEALNVLIAAGEADGEITFNGKPVTAEQVTELMQLYEMLEFALSLDEDVPITDETVANLQSLAEAVASGELDFAQQLGVTKSAAPKKSMLLGAAPTNPNWPSTQSGSGNLPLNGDPGEKYYMQYYIGKAGAEGGAGFQNAHRFKLLDQNATQYYTDDLYDGSDFNHGAYVKLELVDGDGNEVDYVQNYNGTFGLTQHDYWVKATLSAPQPVPVSFKLRMVDGSYVIRDEAGGLWHDKHRDIPATKEMTVEWPAGDNSEQMIFVDLEETRNYFNGASVFYLQAYDFRNTQLYGRSTRDVWEKEVQVFPAEEDDGVFLRLSKDIFDADGVSQDVKDNKQIPAGIFGDATSSEEWATYCLYGAFQSYFDSSRSDEPTDNDKVRKEILIRGTQAPPDENLSYQLEMPELSIQTIAYPKIDGLEDVGTVYSHERFKLDAKWGIDTDGITMTEEYTGSMHIQSCKLNDDSAEEPNIYYQFSKDQFNLTFKPDHVDHADYYTVDYQKYSIPGSELMDEKGYFFWNLTITPGVIKGYRGDTSYYYAVLPAIIPKLKFDLTAQLPTSVKVEDVYIPDGKFYYEQHVPITVTFNTYVTVSDDITLEVNGEKLKPAAGQVGLVSKKCTFAYPVKAIDTATVRVTKLEFNKNNIETKTSAVKDGTGATTHLTNSELNGIEEAKLQNNDCKLISDNKQGSLYGKDSPFWTNPTFGIDDEAPTMQNIVIQYDLRSDNKAYYEWITETESVNFFQSSGKTVPVVDKNGETFEAKDYLYGAYYSCDGGLTRYPLYVKRETIGQSAEAPVALVANIAPPVNPSADIRQDIYELFFELGTISENKSEATPDAKQYLPAFEEAVQDSCGNYYFVCGTRDETVTDKLVFTLRADLSDANNFYSEWYSAYVKGGIFLEESYGDVTVVGNSTWNSVHSDCAIETSVPTLKLGYTINDRQPDADPYYTKNMFTFRDDQWFTWTSSDEEIATIENDGTINLTGKPGTCHFTLHVLNGNVEQFMYTLDSEDLTVKEGLSPYLMIPETSAERHTLRNAETAVYFTTNLTARNAAEGKSATDYKIEVYRTADVNEYDEPEDEAVPVYTGSITNTLTASVARLVIPENILSDVSSDASDYTYVAIVSTDYFDGSPYTVSAHIFVKMPPVRAKLDRLESYYVLSDEIPAIGYTVENAAVGVDMYYTVQKPDGTLQKFPVTAETGTVDAALFTKPAGLKDVYAVTLYAKNPEDEAYSIDAMSLTVYNRDTLDLIVADVVRGQIGGTTGGKGDDPDSITMDNTSYIKSMVSGHVIPLGAGGAISFDELRFDTNLQKAISVNYGEAVYGMLSDRIAWASADSGVASVDYEQGGMYSDVEAYTYTSYAPVNDLLIVGHKNGKTTVTAEHVSTGVSRSLNVDVHTLKDQLYVFQFLPRQVTTVQYNTTVNGRKTQVTVQSNAEGQLAVYEPNGIQSDVWLKAGTAGELYLGTIYQDELYSAEKDITALRVYPCNDKALQLATETRIYFRNPDGTPYANKTVTLRGGVYKNNLYCPNANFRTNADGYASRMDGRADFTAKTDGSGAITIKMDADQFYVNSGSEELLASDMLDFVFEYRFSEANYVPGYVTCTVNADQSSDTADGLVNIISAANKTPVVIRQTVQQYYKKGGVYQATDYIMDVASARNNVGPSNEFEKVRLENIVALRGVSVTTGANGYAAFDNAAKYSVCLIDENNVTPKGQNLSDKAAAVVTDLRMLADETTAAFVFPFSAVPMLRSVYVMNRANLGQTGTSKHKADDGSMVYNYSYLGYGESVHAKVVTKKNGATAVSAQLPFALTNYADKSNPQTDGSTEKVGRAAQNSVKDRLDIGSVFDQVDVNDMLKLGFKFFMSLGMEAAGIPIDLAIFPTEDPATFRVLISIGLEGGDEDEEEDEDSLDLGYNVEVSPKQAMKAIEELTKDDDDDDDDEDGESEGSFSFNFHGAVEAEVTLKKGNWDVEFVGGSVGAGAKAGYKYSMPFMVGPVPATISFEAGAGADLTVFFAKGTDTTDIMIKALLEISLEAFAGVGVDATLFELTLGIFGKITAEAEILFLKAAYSSMGMHLGIDGEIGLRFTARVAMIGYSAVFASTSFGWEKNYKDYTKIQDYWDNKGLHLMGMTNNGDPVKVLLSPQGDAVLTVSQSRIESRSYLNDFSREWTGGRMLLGAAPVPPTPGTPSLIQSNAYPYAQPSVTDDGEVLIYLSDEDSSDKVKSVLNYALLQNGGTYDEYGPVDAGMTPKSFADTAAALSGTDGNYFAAWVGQVEEQKKEAGEVATGDDLAMMMNASEIFAAVYNKSSESWNVTRLTDNSSGDFAPAVASAGTKAIAAWRNVDSANLQTGDEENLLGSFNVSDMICYRYFNGAVWKTAQVAYNGSCGSTNSVSAAMLPDGTALLAYSVTTDAEDAASSEVFCTLIDKTGLPVNTMRLTNDADKDQRVSAAAVNTGSGNQFVLGWYCEHSDYCAPTVVGGESTETVSRDLRFAAVAANGAVNSDFVESLGSEAGEDFVLVSKPGGKLTDLAILWSAKNGDADAYEVRAVRFCDVGDGTVVLSAPQAVAETEKLVTVENFDAYQNGSGELCTVLLGADYSGGRIREVGTVDLTSLTDMNGQKPPVTPDEDTLAILEIEPEYKLFKAAKALPQTGIEASVKQPDLQKLTRGLSLPVGFTVTNTGTDVIDTITVDIDGQIRTLTDQKLLPGRAASFTVGYAVPATLKDAAYTVTANGVSDSGTITLNCPDVGIKTVRLLSEEDTQRTVEVALENASDIPLSGSGKTVKLAFYKDSSYKTMIGSEIVVPTDEYENIDLGICALRHTLSVSDVLGGPREIPEDGAKVYIRAWVEDTDEPYTLNNADMITLRSLLTKNGQKTFTMNADVIPDGENYTLSVFARNNSVRSRQSGRIDALLLDESGAVVGSKQVFADESFTGEQVKPSEIAVLASEVQGVPVAAQLVSVDPTGATVTFDANGGSCTVSAQQVGTDGKLGYLPTPTHDTQSFAGWFTEAKGGTAITKDTVFDASVTVYAHWSTGSTGGSTGGTGSGTGTGTGTVNTETAISLPTETAHGSVTLSPENPAPGETVTLTLTPEEGFTAETLILLDQNGEVIEVIDLGNGQYSFTMPEGAVTVSTTFTEDGTADDAVLNAFTDIKSKSYYYDAVKWAAQNDITKGTDAAHFGPNESVTRAQVVTFLWRAAGCPEPTGSEGKFTDVKAGSYYAKAVAWAVEQGITKGTSKTRFSPNDPCTRGQTVTFVARCAGVKDAKTASSFTDVKKTAFYAAAVKWAKENGVTDGTSATTFSPKQKCTRAQAVTFLYRWMVK